jgi:hypothetical protein
MRPFANILVVALAASGAALPACSANIHDNTVNVNAQISITSNSDLNDVRPGSTVSVSINASSVFPVAPDQTPPPEHVNDAVFFKFFIDDDSSDSDAVLVTASLSASVQIKSDIQPGHHKLICRMFKHDNTPTTTTSSLDFTVTASVGVMTNTDGGTD